MEFKKDTAIVLRSIPYEDRHQIITALTHHHGRVAVIAKNSIQSRRFGASLEIFCASEWNFKMREGTEFGFLDEAQMKWPFEAIRKDFKSLALASTFNEIVLKLALPVESGEDLFRIHSNALKALEEILPFSEDRREFCYLVLLNAYIAKLLQWSGHQPQLSYCQKCRKPLQDFVGHPDLSLIFRVDTAQWHCFPCEQAHPPPSHSPSSVSGSYKKTLSPEGCGELLRMLTKPFRQLSQEPSIASKKQLLELFEVLEAVLIYHIPGFDRSPLKSLRFLDLQSNEQPL